MKSYLEVYSENVFKLAPLIVNFILLITYKIYYYVILKRLLLLKTKVLYKIIILFINSSNIRSLSIFTLAKVGPRRNPLQGL